MKRRVTTSGKASKRRPRKATKPKRRPATAVARRKRSSDADLQEQVRALTRELTEAREEQTATSEVLKVISSSPGELEPVFHSMLANAVKLCEAKFGVLFRYDNNGFRPTAALGAPAKYAKFMQKRGSFHPDDGAPLQQLLLAKSVVSRADDLGERAPGPAAKYGGARSLIAVPMLKDGQLVGAFVIYRQEVRPFTDNQIELIKSFAAQAVIAIENTRLLNELRQRTDDLSESLEQQTATSEVLKVISSSPGDLQPVFEAMLDNAMRVCGAEFGQLNLCAGDAFRRVAARDAGPAIEIFENSAVFRPDGDAPIARAAALQQVVHVEDFRTEPAYLRGSASAVSFVEVRGARTVLAVPMVQDRQTLGVFLLFRREVRLFEDKHIELVQNFAAQAVIAIENTRLLNELRESLQQQTATAEVLKVISSSPGELEPVFQSMLENATRICGAKFGTLYLCERDGFRSVAMHNAPSEYAEWRRQEPLLRPRPGSGFGRLASTKSVVHIVDMLAEPERGRLADVAGARTILIVPLLKENELIGGFSIFRREVEAFTDKQIELLTNFAAQAVIAIENTRLLNELRQRTDDLSETLKQQTAISEILRVISNSPSDVKPVLSAVAEHAARICEAQFVDIIIAEDGMMRREASFGKLGTSIQDAVRLDRSTVMGRSICDKKAVQVADLQSAEHEFPLGRQFALKNGHRTTLGVPLVREGRALGTILVRRTEVRPFGDNDIALLTTFADQAAIAIENTRLLNELRLRTEESEEKGRQLAEASQHKSQFLANMSHELRTPLNAILGYTELIIDGIYGETPEKAQVVLKRVESNGKHLLGLINDVLDLSKIEAGQLKLSLADYSVKDVVYNVFSAVEPLALKKNLSFKVDVPPAMPTGHGDEHRLTQVLLNLVGNAIKFTDAGEVSITATAANGSFSVAVHDTGPGIATADQTKLFEEFQQADNSITKAKGGTGLGLAISRRIVELHGGRLWVESSLGHGSTFTFMLPIKVEQQARPS